MSTQTQKRTIKKLTSGLKQVKPEITPIIMNQLISEFYLQDTDPATVEEIMKQVTSNLLDDEEINYDLNWLNFDSYITQLYNGTAKANKGLDGTTFLLSNHYDNAESTTYFNHFKRALQPYTKLRNYDIEIGTGKTIVLNQKEKCIKYEFMDGQGNIYDETIINAYPQKIIIHDSPLDDIGRTFSISWTSQTSKTGFETKRQTIKEIESYLEDAGWVITPRRLRGCLAATIQIAVTYKLAEVKNEIDNPGVYWDKNAEELKLINYETHEPTNEELNNALDVLESLGQFFKGHENKLSTGIKWGLMSFFNYSIKQAGGDWIPWLYLYGKAGSGKTTLGKIILFLWDMPNEDNDIGGSSFDTVARVGNRVSQFTLPILINEPEGALNKPSVSGMLKSCIENTTARGKYQGKAYRTIPSFSAGIITANQPLPAGDALHRRFLIIMFSHNEKKKGENKQNFDETFKINSPKFSILNRLKGLSNYFIYEITKNPQIIKNMHWKEIANLLIGRAYLDCNRKAPDWIYDWYEEETLDNLDDEEREEIRLFFAEKITQAYNRKIQVWSEETGRPVQEDLDADLKTTQDFDSRTWTVLNQKLIPWMGLHRSKNGVEVYCTTGIKKELKDVTSSSYNLQSVAELLEWDYKLVKLPKVTRVMIVPYNAFLNFVFPDLSESEGLGDEKEDSNWVTL